MTARRATFISVVLHSRPAIGVARSGHCARVQCSVITATFTGLAEIEEPLLLLLLPRCACTNACMDAYLSGQKPESRRRLLPERTHAHKHARVITRGIKRPPVVYLHGAAKNKKVVVTLR